MTVRLLPVEKNLRFKLPSSLFTCRYVLASRMSMRWSKARESRKTRITVRPDFPSCSPSSVGLLNNDHPDEASTNRPPHASKLLDGLRMFRLQLIGQILKPVSALTSQTELPKVAVYHSRRMAAVHSLLHFIPLSGAVTLLVLHWTKFWTGETSNDATTLQFVAKFHELVMQASIVNVLLCIIRTQALDGYVPMGMLSGAAEATHLSYLWSLDFISAVTSPALNYWRKALFALSMVLLILMTALVGPSAAVLMIPRPNTPLQYATITKYLNGTESSLFPTFVNQSHQFSA